jgi:hypothetical protein
VSIRNYSNTATQSTLSTSIGATDTSIALANYAGDPTPPFTAALARGTATEEIVLVTAVIGSTVTVTRGYDGTSAQAQAAGATFQEVVVAADFREANTHVNTTGAAHGTSSQLVGVSDTQTLTNKTLVAPQVSALTGTGTTTLATLNVTTLAASGTTSLTSATVSASLTVSGATSLAALTASGNASVGGTLTVTGISTLTGALAANGGVTTTTLSTSGQATLASAQVTAAPAAAADVVRKDYVAARVVQPDAGWTTATYQNGWVDYGFPGWTGARYRKLSNGQVEVQGMVKSGTVGTGTPVFTLPPGYRPNATTMFPVLGANNLGRVDVQADGKVCIGIGSSGNFTSLNFTFFADA